MPYRSSPHLTRWHTDRRSAVTTLAAAAPAGEPLEQAYVLRVVSEFQGFARDLHRFAVVRLLAGFPTVMFGVVSDGLTDRLDIDRGNASVRALQSDFRRLGVRDVSASMGTVQPLWVVPPPAVSDRRRYEQLLQLRNALAHGNEGELEKLRAAGVRDTVAATQRTLAALDRAATALDRVVWDHLRDVTGRSPW